MVPRFTYKVDKSQGLNAILTCTTAIESNTQHLSSREVSPLDPTVPRVCTTRSIFKGKFVSYYTYESSLTR